MTTKWTASQLAAIEHVGGDLLVSAAAGSGKTAVLAERCARLVCEVDAEDGGCGVEGLLVLTFTEAAANEMRGRIAEAIREKAKSEISNSKSQISDFKVEIRSSRPERLRWLRRQGAMVDRASISTLHGFCARVLRQHFHEAGIDPSFEVMDEDEARLLRDDVLTELLAKGHGEGEGSEFAGFLEAYAQGREGDCREIVLKVYRMLSSTADPAGYVAGARGLYSKEGRRGTLERYVREAVVGQLELFGMTVGRSVAAVRAGLGEGQMLAALEELGKTLEETQKELTEKGAVALKGVRERLAAEWPRLKPVKGVEGYAVLKERNWDGLKKKMGSLVEKLPLGDVAGWLGDLAAVEGALDALLKLVGDFMAAYGVAKRGQNRLDFSDLERMTLDVLTAPGSLAAAELRARYCHILVDEFQDVNPLQAALLEAVRSGERFEGKGNLFVVGDVKQSIYGFRLAEPELFLEREKRARAETEAGRGGFVGLPHNFRSHPNLLLAMNDLFERLLTEEVAGVDYGKGHALEASPGFVEKEGAGLLTGRPVEVHLVAMDWEEEGEDEEAAGGGKESLTAVEEEARMVAERIAGLMAEGRMVAGKDGGLRKLRYRDVAILLRSMKDRAMIFARALAARGIPVHADLSSGYFDTAEVRDALALLQVLDNPMQDIPLATVLLGPYGRFSHDDVATVRLAYERKSVSFPEAVERYAREGTMPPKGGTTYALEATTPPEGGTTCELAARLGAFLEKIARWRGRLKTRALDEGLAEIFSEARIFAYLAGSAAGAQRAANLQALHQRALKFAGFRKQGLHRFLRFVEKLRDQEGDFGEAPVLSEASDVVRIMSVHKSKGLEFPVVVAAGMGSKMNLIQSGPVFVHRDLGIGMHVADVERNIFYPSAASSSIVEANGRTGRAEELRLLYVALTRARDYLILSGHVGKAEKLEEVRGSWGGWSGALPEDVLVRGGTLLDWVLPALAGMGGRVRWPGEEVAGARVEVTLHAASGASRAVTAGVVEEDERVRRILAAEPLGEVVRDAEVARMAGRVMGVYGHEELARRAAVTTVSQLKTVVEEADLGEEIPGARVEQRGLGGGLVTLNAAAGEARLKGIATHRVLELVDFAKCAGGVKGEVARLVAEKKISAEDVARADVGGIDWFIGESETGRRLVEMAGREGVVVRREIAFAWASPVGGEETGDVADWPTVRGVIDVLVVDVKGRTAEILDYKTDSDFSWEGNVEGYRRQMGYYLRAAGEILGFGVGKATLVFLTARKLVEVALA